MKAQGRFNIISILTNEDNTKMDKYKQHPKEFILKTLVTFVNLSHLERDWEQETFPQRSDTEPLRREHIFTWRTEHYEYFMCRLKISTKEHFSIYSLQNGHKNTYNVWNVFYDSKTCDFSLFCHCEKVMELLTWTRRHSSLSTRATWCILQLLVWKPMQVSLFLTLKATVAQW
jgi:hypothetical protein